MQWFQELQNLNFEFSQTNQNEFLISVLPEGEKQLGGRGAVVIGGDNLPSLVWIGLTDLQNIGGPVATLAPPVPAPLYEFIE